MIERVNKIILDAGNNISAALLLIIIAYLGVELLNFQVIADYISKAGYGSLGGFIGASVISLLLFTIFWLLIGYQSKGYNTWLLWTSLIIAIQAITILNWQHAENGHGQILAVAFAIIALMSGLISKQTISYQIKEQHVKDSLQTAQEQLSTLYAKIKQTEERLQDSLTQEKTALDALKAEKGRMKAELTSLKNELETADSLDTKVIEAIQMQALVLSGKTQQEIAEQYDCSVATVRRRLNQLPSLNGKD